VNDYWIALSKLDTRQKAILKRITERDGPHWISGYAGTGKTLLLAYALNEVRRKFPRKSLCYITYTHSLCELARTGLTHGISVHTVDSFLANDHTYDLVFVDEVQDLKRAKIEKIQALCDNVIWAGDPAQSIYHGVVDMDDLPQVLGTKQQEWAHLYRLSESVFRIASAVYPLYSLLPGAKTFGTPVTVQVIHAQNQNQEYEWIWSRAKLIVRPGHPCVVLFPTHKQIYEFAALVTRVSNAAKPPKGIKPGGAIPMDYSAFNDHMRKNKIALQFLGSNNGSLKDGDASSMCYLMTYKSAKGLSFDSVFLPSLDEGASFEDGKTVGIADEMQRRYLFVALTRTRRDLFLSYSGNPHPYLSEFPRGASKKIVL
jgi:superfamily I DNA/RNA helicase